MKEVRIRFFMKNHVKPWDSATSLPTRKRLLDKKEITSKMERLEVRDYFLSTYRLVVATIM